MTNVYDSIYTTIAIKLAAVQREMHQLTLVRVTLRINRKGVHSPSVNRAQDLIVRVRGELNGLNRAVVIEEYLDQIEALLERMD